MNQSQGYEPMFTWAQLQAAVAAEREKAAKVCDMLAGLIENNGQFHAIQIEALTDASAAIRGMK